MLEKYLNKEVKVLIKSLGVSSTGDIEKGILTSVEEKFIELDNKKMINLLNVHSITLE